MLNKTSSKKLKLNRDTMRTLDARELSGLAGGTTSIFTTVFSEGACDGYSWKYACPK